MAVAQDDIDDVFAFSPPPIIDIQNTHLYSPSRTSLPSTSLHHTSLLEISPTSRPFGSPGPTFYPKTPDPASPLVDRTIEALPILSTASYHLPSLQSASLNSSETEVVQRRETEITSGPLIHTSSATLSYNSIPTYGGAVFEETKRGLDASKLELPDVPKGHWTPPISLTRPRLESPTEPLHIDVDFRFARAPHAAARAPDGLKSRSGSVGVDTTRSSSHSYLQRGIHDFVPCASPPLMISTEPSVDKNELCKMSVGAFLPASSNSGRAPISLSTQSGNNISWTAQDVLSPKLFTHTDQLPQLVSPKGCTLPKSGGKGKKKIRHWNLSHINHIRITDQSWGLLFRSHHAFGTVLYRG